MPKVNALLRWRLEVLMFGCLLTWDFYQAAGEPRGVPAAGAWLALAMLASCMGGWVKRDARLRQRVLPYGFGFWVFAGWPVIVPVYLFKTRGWRAFRPIFVFLLMYTGAAVVSVMGLWLRR